MQMHNAVRGCDGCVMQVSLELTVCDLNMDKFPIFHRTVRAASDLS